VRNQPIKKTQIFRPLNQHCQHISYLIEENRGQRITLPQTLLGLEKVTQVIIHLNAHTTLCDHFLHPLTPHTREFLHPKYLLQEVTINFIIGLLKI
jgi:hypothetical protein